MTNYPTSFIWPNRPGLIFLQNLFGWIVSERSEMKTTNKHTPPITTYKRYWFSGYCGDGAARSESDANFNAEQVSLEESSQQENG